MTSKIAVIFMAIASLTMLADAGSPFDSLTCRVLFSNGTISTANSDCSAVGNLFTCEDFDLENIPSWLRNMGPLANIEELSVCKPITCQRNSTCMNIDSRSRCTTGIPIDKNAFKTLVDSSCNFPARSQRPNMPWRLPNRRGNNNDRPDRCTIPPQLILEKMACQVTTGGTTTNQACPNIFGQQLACSSQPACTFPIAGQSASLTFCERPSGFFGGFGGR